MKKPRFFFWTFSLVAALLVFACAPASTSTSAPQPLPPVDLSTATESAAAPIATEAPAQVVDVLPVATSRGPNLEASDPASARLDAGQLQLVEFFRFT